MKKQISVKVGDWVKPKKVDFIFQVKSISKMFVYGGDFHTFHLSDIEYRVKYPKPIKEDIFDEQISAAVNLE